MSYFMFTHYQRMPEFIKHYVSRMIFRPCIGRGVGLFGNILFGPDVSIGDYSYIHGPSYISNASVGKYCGIAKRFSIITSNHNHHTFTNYPFIGGIGSPLKGRSFPNNDAALLAEGTTNIGNDVWIGEGVTLMRGVSIGDGAVIGACSFVNKNIPPYSIAVGVPAKVIKFRFTEENREMLQTVKWWDWDLERIYTSYEELCSIVSTHEVSKGQKNL